MTSRSVYAGTALRAMASQMQHHCGVVSFAASLTAEVFRSAASLTAEVFRSAASLTAEVFRSAASLTAEVFRSEDHDLFDLLPTHRSNIGYRRGRTNYVIHPDASFTLEYKGRWLPFLLEFERRATTPKRTPRRLASYQRYLASGWAEREHGGRLPSVLFVFETPESETAFIDVADATEGLDVITANNAGRNRQARDIDEPAIRPVQRVQ